MDFSFLRNKKTSSLGGSPERLERIEPFERLEPRPFDY
jgi:hypothetical protein